MDGYRNFLGGHRMTMFLVTCWIFIPPQPILSGLGHFTLRFPFLEAICGCLAPFLHFFIWAWLRSASGVIGSGVRSMHREAARHDSQRPRRPTCVNCRVSCSYMRNFFPVAQTAFSGRRDCKPHLVAAVAFIGDVGSASLPVGHVD